MYFYLARGGFCIRRAGKHFSRCPVDVTLEQTVNRDAASTHIGISAFKDSIKNRQRWTITRSTRGKLLEMTGLSNLEEASQETKPYRIIRKNRDVEEIINALRSK